ncbi:hypothetical protein HYH02_012385 [Chlamydomonas schloesseri]|uniref:Protein kinase domain-containing protein n=1 Tax=Chlamydomonas schloesseri TaxID=2026947 RepID=A0A835T8I4_9CHLO|nr:hypothetical protein HYH02_012385 [Chlamydomonas schloesseri]|eukprot:KAG2434370.1 hypothetical protein HYH02_012385 [Chlamydomonas schloesseri]
MATAAMKPPGGSIFNYYSKQKQQSQQQQCSESTSSLQMSMRHMNLGDVSRPPGANPADGPQVLSQEPRPHMRALRPRVLDLSSQPSQEQYTPDHLTPQEQLFRMEYEPSTMQVDDDVSRSPAPSPRAMKRPRPLKVLPGNMDDEVSSQSQSQSRSVGEPSTCSKALSGRPPIPKLREVQPPMPRNPYLVRADDDNHVFQASQSCLNRGNYSRFLWDYHQEAELGHGNFSKVYKAVHRLTGIAYAVKTNKVPITTLQARNMWLNEMQALAAVQPHPNIVGLYDTWFEPGGDAEQAYIKQELCGESLRDMFKRRVQFKEAEVLEILRQMASALKRIHDLGMVHLDVKPDNIYLAAPSPADLALRAASSAGVSGSAASGSNAAPVYKLGDFGLAMLPGGQRAGTSEGDVKYLAPEALKSRDFLTSGLADRLDVFALGASVYELLRGTELPKNGQGYHDVRQGKLFLPSCSTRIINLLKKMMSPDPAQRPTADGILRSTLLQAGTSSSQLAATTSTPLPMSQ